VRYVTDASAELFHKREDETTTVMQNKYYYLILDLQKLERDIANDAAGDW